MSDCSFQIPFTSSASELVAKAKKAIEKAGGEVQGEANTGNFSIPSPLGKISGNYTITGQSASFVITQKPMFVSCGLIESTIQKYLSEQPV
ncbi:MAG TPA: hypothetical protein VNB90_10945 [Cytophagaceae bacterium]|nr:hypothetical protein [Cytophagaceae bacterium]